MTTGQDRPAVATADLAAAGAGDDAAVIRRSLQEPGHFEVLWRRHAVEIQRFAVRRIGVDAADDVVAETFLTAFHRRAGYDGRPRGLGGQRPGRQQAARLDPIYPPPVSFASLGSLPDPHALIRFLGHAGPYVPGDSDFPDLRALQVIGLLLSSFVMPPRLTAELYQAMGDIPGVTVDDHAVDVAGQHGIGFLLRVPALGNGTQFENVVNRRTYQFMGYQFAGWGIHLGGYAVVRQALVSGPGVQP